MKQLLELFSIPILILACTPACFAQNPLWGSLKPGPYQIGFQIVNKYDYGRYILPKQDFEGKRNNAETAIPVQIAIWYPAEVDPKGEKMLFQEYSLIDRPVSFDPITENEKRASLESIRRLAKNAANTDVSDAEMEKISQTPTAVVKDAPQKKGPFPVIICKGGRFMSVLNEFLASKGYVVLSINSGGPRLNPALQLQKEVDDLEYLAAFAHTLSYVDTKQVGMMGGGMGSIAALSFQMKNMIADAIVSIEGWENSGNSNNTLLRSIYFDANKMRIPFFSVNSDNDGLTITDQFSHAVFDTLLYSHRYQCQIKGLNHFHIVANLDVLPNLTTEKTTAYNFLNTSVGNFFDAYLKKSEQGLLFIKKTAAENGYPEGMMKSEIKRPALPPVPTNDELAKLFADEQYEKIARILKDAKKLNPSLNSWGSVINNQGYSLLRNKKYPQAITIFTLNTELYPDNAGWFDSLSDGYEAAGDKENMKKASQKVLDLLGKKVTLTNSEKSLQETAGKKLNQ